MNLKIGDFTVSSSRTADNGKLRSTVIHLKKVQNTLDGVLPSVSACQHELAAIGWKHILSQGLQPTTSAHPWKNSAI
jgi:hypothetical protein